MPVGIRGRGAETASSDGRRRLAQPAETRAGNARPISSQGGWGRPRIDRSKLTGAPWSVSSKYKGGEGKVWPERLTRHSENRRASAKKQQGAGGPPPDRTRMMGGGPNRPRPPRVLKNRGGPPNEKAADCKAGAGRQARYMTRQHTNKQNRPRNLTSTSSRATLGCCRTASSEVCQPPEQTPAAAGHLVSDRFQGHADRLWSVRSNNVIPID